MERTKLIQLLLASYLCSFFLVAFWWLNLWQASRPIALAADVKGASSTTQAPNSAAALSAYPTLNMTSTIAAAAKEYVVYDPDSGHFLVESPVMDPVPIASTTKYMTAYIVATLGNLDDVVTIEADDATQPGSSMGLRTGENISVHNLLRGALIVSGNDAAWTLAKYGGSKLLGNSEASAQEKVGRFVEEMNKTAKNLYLTNTRYKDPAGLNDEGHSTARDLAKLASVANQNPVIRQIIGTETITVYNERKTIAHVMTNSNRWTSQYKLVGNIGGKTGFTFEAGHCLISAAERNGHTLIVVVLHTNKDTVEASAEVARELVEFGFSQIKWN